MFPSDEELRAIDSEVRAAPWVALDTEFHAERRYHPRLFLVQVALPQGEPVLLDALAPCQLDGLPALRSTPWVVHGGEQDIRILNRRLGEVPPVRDVQIAAGLVGHVFPAPFAQLVDTWLGLRVSKLETLSDWSKRPLSEQQASYARRDVELLRPLYARLSKELADRGRTALFEHACQAARQAALEPATDETWRQVRGVETLDPAQAAIAQELAIWREATASDLDQPVRSVLSDGLLLEIARTAPTSADRILRDRRFPKGIGRDHGVAIIEAVARGARRPTWGLPAQVVIHSDHAAVRDFLRACIDAVGRESGFAVNLLLPKTVLDPLVVEPARSQDELVQRLGWRAPLLAEPLWEAMNGQLTLSVRGGRVLAGARR